MSDNNPYQPATETTPDPFRYQDELDPPLATRWERFFGYLIDTVALIIVYVPIAIVLVVADEFIPVIDIEETFLSCFRRLGIEPFKERVYASTA